jgi:hypothetical protein
VLYLILALSIEKTEGGCWSLFSYCGDDSFTIMVSLCLIYCSNHLHLYNRVAIMFDCGYSNVIKHTTYMYFFWILMAISNILKIMPWTLASRSLRFNW